MVTIKSWEELKLKHLMQIDEISNRVLLSDDEKDLMVGAILNGMEYNEFINQPISKVQEMMGVTEFLYSDIKKEKAKKHYVINGKNYTLMKNESEMTVSQYIDYQALGGDFRKYPAQLLSVFLVPEGHTYNDGYDKEEVEEDMLEISVVEAASIADFFTKRYIRLIQFILVYLKLKVKVEKMKMKLTRNQEKKEHLQAILLEMELIINQLEGSFGYRWLRR